MTTTLDTRRVDNNSPSPRIESGTQAPKDSAEKFLGTKESMASSPHTFHNALVAALEFIRKTEGATAQVSVDTTHNPEAARWKQEAARLKLELQDPNIKALFESKAATRPQEINKFLESKGFSIRLKDNGEWFYVASVFKQKVNWREAWKGVDIHFMEDQNRTVEWVEIKKWNVMKYDYQGKAVYELATDNGDKVYMMSTWNNNINTTPIDLYQKIRTIHEWKGRWTPWNDLRFPKVNLDEKWSIDWLIWAKVWEYTVSQAEYQNKLQMDENGAVAEAAVAVATTRSISIPQVDVIDWPMYVWFVKPWMDGKDTITFAARVGESAFIKKK